MYYIRIKGKRVFDQLAVRTNCCTFHTSNSEKKLTVNRERGKKGKIAPIEKTNKRSRERRKEKRKVVGIIVIITIIIVLIKIIIMNNVEPSYYLRG